MAIRYTFNGNMKAMALRFSINGNRNDTYIQNLKKDSFAIDGKYTIKKIIYETDHYAVAEGIECDQITGCKKLGTGFQSNLTKCREIEIKKYIDPLSGSNWNWNNSLKVLNELKVYNTLADQTKMVSLVDVMLRIKSKSIEDEYRKIFNCKFRDMYLVFETYGNDLSSYFLSRTLDEMNNIQQQWLLSELLSAVSSLHSQKLMHRDLRPSNVCVCFEEKIVKIKSFGLSSGFSSKVFLLQDEEKTDNKMITPIYSAPEIILGKPCSPLVDVWSVGCIFAEILSGGSPLFFVPSGLKPTKISRIGAVVVTLDTEGSLDKLSSNSLAIDLLRRMLVFKPCNRISLEEAMQHAYFGGTEKEELVLGGTGSSSKVEEGVAEVTEPAIGVVEPDAHSLRKLIWNEMKTFEMNKNKTSEIPTCENF